MDYICEEVNKSALERLGLDGMFKSRALWRVRDGKGLKQKFYVQYISVSKIMPFMR
jgi:hypothetical protein